MSTKERELVSSYEHVGNGGVTTRLVEEIVECNYSAEDRIVHREYYSQHLEFSVSCYGHRMTTRVPVSELSSSALRLIADQIDAHAGRLSDRATGPHYAKLTVLGEDKGYIRNVDCKNVSVTEEELFSSGSCSSGEECSGEPESGSEPAVTRIRMPLGSSTAEGD